MQTQRQIDKKVSGDRLSSLVLGATSLLSAAPALAVANLNGQLLGAGAPIANSNQMSPAGGYVGDGLQLQTDIAGGPAGDVWAINNWSDIDSCYGVKTEALSTRCGGHGVVIFFGIARPVRAPQIGPARPL